MSKLEEKSQNTNRTLMRLEKKLIELGYEKDSKYMYSKNLDRCYILITIYGNLIVNYGLSSTDFIRDNDGIDNLQQAFNIMQKDVEELKQCQD